MAKRRFNWILAIVLLIAFSVLAVTAFGLRKWQRNRMAYGAREAGLKAYEGQNWQDAAENLGRYLAVEQTNVEIMLKYARAQLNIRPLERGNIEQAVNSYRTILRIDRTNLAAAENLISLYLQMSIPAEAQLIAERYLQVDENPKIRRMLAVSMAEQRNFKEAAEQLQTIINDHPEQVQAYEAMGQLVERYPQDFSTTAEYWFDQAITNNPSSALAHLTRAAFHLRTKEKHKAFTDLQQAENLDLSDDLVRLRLAKELIDANSLEKAEKHLELLQNNMSGDLGFWKAKAQLALKSGSKAKILDVAESGLTHLASQPWDFMPTAAELYIQCGELDLADDCISKLRRKDIAPPTTALLEGILAERRGSGYEAVKHYRKAIQSGGKSGRVRLMLVAALARLGDEQSGIQQLRTLVSEKPDSIAARTYLARLLIETGNWADAAQQALAVMQLSPESPESALLYIQAQIRLLAQRRTGKDSPAWTDVENQLAALQGVPDKELAVKTLEIQLATKRSQFHRAQQLIDEIKQSYPAHFEIILSEIELLTAQQKTDEAILKLYDVVNTFPKSVKLVKSLAALLADVGKIQECEKTLKDALNRVAQPAARREFGLLLSAVYNHANRHEDAYQLLNTLANEMPDDIPLKRELLKCRKVTTNFDHAQQLVDAIKAIEGEQGWQWRYEQARVWFASENFENRYPRIISLLEECLLVNPNDQDGRLLLAATYERLGKLKLAISTYQEALNRSPYDLRIIIPVVTALYEANEYDRADQILQRAAGEEVFHPELKKLQLQSYLKRGQVGSACDVLEDMLVDDPNDHSAGLTLALLKMQQNQLQEAANLLARVRTQQPDSLPVTAAQIELNARQGKSDEALRLCQQVINDHNNASAYILRARTYAILGLDDRAEEDFERAAAVEPNSTQAWVAISDFYRYTGVLDKAFSNIKKAWSLEPDSLGISKRMLSLLLASRNRDALGQAENILGNALALYPEDTELHLYKARLLLTEATATATAQALDILQKITEDQPKISEAWGLVAEIALRRQQSAKAIDTVLRGLVHSPNDKSLLLLKARAEAATSPELAVPTLRALLESSPNDLDVALHLAETYVAAEDAGKAVNLLTEQLTACDDTSGERRVRHALAAALHRAGRKADAGQEFDSLCKSAPEDPTPLLTQARLLKEDRQWEQLSRLVCDWYRDHLNDTYTPTAVAADLTASQNTQAQKAAENILTLVLEYDSNCSEAMSALAVLLQITGRNAESAALYRRILAVQSDNVVAINNLAWILCQEYGKCEEALELAQRGLEVKPRYIDLIDTRGVTYYKLGHYQKAIDDFTTCLEMYPQGTSSAVASYLHLAKALAMVGQNHEAMENVRRALKLNAEYGGLSPTDVAEAQSLLDKLSQGV